MRQLDAKMRVLTAIYAEYQKDVPNMRRIDDTLLRMDRDAFLSAVIKLQNEELVKGLITKPPEEMQIGAVEEIDMRRVMPTVEGMKTVEHFVQYGTTDTAEARLERLKKAAGLAEEIEIERIIDSVMEKIKNDEYIRDVRGLR